MGEYTQWIDAALVSPLGTEHPVLERPTMGDGENLAALHASFCELGTCEEPMSAAKVDTLVAPPEIKELLLLSREWHLLQKDHYNVFGVNLFNQDGVVWNDKNEIFGDQEGTEEWAKEHDSPNCAQEGWECFAAVSEFHYIFVYVKPGENCGATRLIVNNCFEDESFTTAPFGNFLKRLGEYVTLYKEKRKKVEEDETDEGVKQEQEEEEEDEEDEEELDFVGFFMNTT